MKKTTWIYTILALIVIAGILTMGAYASPLKGKTANEKAGLRGRGLARVGQMLGITDEQKEKLSAIREKYRPEFRESIEGLREAQRNLRDAVTSDKFNESAIRTASVKVGEYRTELSILAGKAWQEISTILTPEQLSKIKEFKAMRQRHADDMLDFLKDMPGE